MPFARIEDNFEMYYTIDDFTDPWKKPETIVLHHGIGKNTRMWYRWAPVLARHYRIVRLDARGFGQSSVPPKDFKWSPDVFTRDLNRLLDYLELDKIHLVGETLGGSVSMLFASDYPERTRSLTICSSPFRFTSHYYLDHAKEIEKDGMVGFARNGMGRRLDPSQVDPAFIDWYAEEMAKTADSTGIGVLRGIAGHDLSDKLRTIEAPTLIMSGDFFLYSQDEIKEMANLIPNAKLILFPGVSGFVHYAQPEKCAETMLDFLRNL